MAFQTSQWIEPTCKADQVTIVARRATSIGAAPRPELIVDADCILPTKKAWPKQSEVPTFYGAVDPNQTQIEISFDRFLAWDKSTRIRNMTIHKKVAAPATFIFHDIARLYSKADRKALGIDMFGGSLNVRKMRGGSSYSIHS